MGFSSLQTAHAAAWSPLSACDIQQGEFPTRIEASSPEMGFQCWGQVHARERGSQMRVLRQTARGRLAEGRGSEFLKSDFMLRLLELERRAAKLESTLPEEDRRLLQSYCDGVNAGAPTWFESDPWRVTDTLMLLLLQSFDQTRRTFEQDIAVDAHARQGHPLQRSFPWETPILKPGEYPSLHEAHSTFYPFAPADEATGSNNWVVAPKFSRTGNALLANDPHLQLKSPPFWHWLQLSWNDERVAGGKVRQAGASVPGVPFIASGASQNLAWGLTNSYVDVADAVLVPKKELKTRTIRPVVWVKKWGIRWPVFFKRFQVTSEADLPVLPVPSPVDGHVIVLRWTGFDVTGPQLSPLWRSFRARTASEFDQELSKVGLPSWNFVFADTNGNIGYRAVGLLPRRQWREPGLMSVLQPQELKPFEVLAPGEAPHLFNPQRGWVATANQMQWPQGAQYSVGSVQTESFRGFRIEELLKQGLSAKHSVSTFQKIQCDAQAVDARFLLPVLLPKLARSEVVDRLSRWNWETSLDCQECAVFRLWMKELGDPQWTYARAREGRAEFWIEVEAALSRAVEKLKRVAGGPWVRWGKIHRAIFPVPEALRPFVTSDWAAALPTTGDDHTVGPGSSDWFESEKDRGFSHHSGASQRMVVELSSPPRIHWMLPGKSGEGGAEENAISPDRKAWADCELRELTSWNSSPGSSAGSR